MITLRQCAAYPSARVCSCSASPAVCVPDAALQGWARGAVTDSFFTLPASRLTFYSLLSVQGDHFGKREHSSVTKNILKRGTFAIVKADMQNPAAEFNLRRKCKMLVLDKWESQPTSLWSGHVQSVLMKKSLFNFPCPVSSEELQMRWAVRAAPGWDIDSYPLQVGKK